VGRVGVSVGVCVCVYMRARARVCVNNEHCRNTNIISSVSNIIVIYISFVGASHEMIIYNIVVCVVHYRTF
jgi:hypothetical protein